jgi:hypothetical protein
VTATSLGLVVDLGLAVALLVLSFQDSWPVIAVAAVVLLVRALLGRSVRDAHLEPHPLARPGGGALGSGRDGAPLRGQ